MERIVKFVAGSLPLLFAFAFVAPVIDHGMQAAGLGAPLGLSTLTFGLVVGGAWGLFATLFGRWV